MCLQGCKPRTEPPAIPLPQPATSTEKAQEQADWIQRLSPPAYRLVAKPFSPSLPYLFTHGRLVVLPEEALTLPGDYYAMSAVDRFGRLYHFDPDGHWTMDEGSPLPEPLPDAGWKVAWNSSLQALEILVTAPYLGREGLQILRYRDGTWWSTKQQAPPASSDGIALFSHHDERWKWLSKKAALENKTDAWDLEGSRWLPWLDASDGLSTSALEMRPKMETVLACFETIDGGYGLLTRDRELWLWQHDQWHRIVPFPTEGLLFAGYLPDREQNLFLWHGDGVGDDKILLAQLTPETLAEQLVPEPLTQTAFLKVNDSETGLATGWVPMKDSRTSRTLSAPAYALELETEYETISIPRRKIDFLELPPSLEDTVVEAAVFSPTLGGLVIPSRHSVGIDTASIRSLNAILPSSLATTATLPISPSLPKIDILRRHGRLWVIRGDEIEWISPSLELHPSVGYPRHISNPAGIQRKFAWKELSSGVIQYAYRQLDAGKMQWVRTPPLTLKQAPGVVDSRDEDSIFLSEPVFFGQPARLAILGWVGQLAQNTTSSDTETHIPQKGFTAWIDAFNPERWHFSSLPIAYSRELKLLASADDEEMAFYAIGAQQWSKQSGQWQAQSSNQVWRWSEGMGWSPLSLTGTAPDLESGFAIGHDPFSGYPLVLCASGLFGFDDVLWQRHDRFSSFPSSLQSQQYLLCTEAETGHILGGWFGQELQLGIWGRNHWIESQLQILGGIDDSWEEIASNTNNWLPRNDGTGWIVLNSPWLNAVRLDLDAELRSDDQKIAFEVQAFPIGQGKSEASEGRLHPWPQGWENLPTSPTATFYENKIPEWQSLSMDVNDTTTIRQ